MASAAADVAQVADGLIDDDVAFAAPWGVVPPAHADWLVLHVRRSELWYRPDDGHVSILDECPAAMDWLTAQHVADQPRS